jgi:hypothetical protein
MEGTWTGHGVVTVTLVMKGVTSFETPLVKLRDPVMMVPGLSTRPEGKRMRQLIDLVEDTVK